MREYEVRVEFSATVKLSLPDGDEATNCCDPDNEMTDREAIENAISSAISQCEVFVYGEERRPAQVFVDRDLTNDLHVEGFEDERQQNGL